MGFYFNVPYKMYRFNKLIGSVSACKRGYGVPGLQLLSYSSASDSSSGSSSSSGATGPKMDDPQNAYEELYHAIKGFMFHRRKDADDSDFRYEDYLRRPASEIKPARQPFIKNLFQGEFDTEVLAWPQVLLGKRLKSLEENVEVLEKFVKEQIDPAEIDRTGKIPDRIKQTLKELKLFGQNVPLEFGGLDFTNAEYARVMEVLSRDLSVAFSQYYHEALCINSIFKCGTDEQKNKYIKKLVSGELLATYCSTEPTTSGEDIFSVQTIATNSNEGWLLNGTKAWVCNGREADLFIVIARTALPEGTVPTHVDYPEVTYFFHNNEYYSVEEEVQKTFNKLVCNNVTLFLVDKTANGISFGDNEDTVGVRGANFCQVTFKDTFVPQEQVLGDINDGHVIATQCPADRRYLIGCMATTTVKSLMDDICNYANTTTLGFRKLSEQGMVQLKLSKMFLNLYAMESIIYLTCGLLDNYEHPDCGVEAAIVKVFCSEAALEAVNEGVAICGLKGYTNKEHYERYLRDTRALTLLDVNNDILRLYICSMGLHHVSNSLNDTVVKQRNPFIFPTQVLKIMWNLRGASKDDPILLLKLHEYLHPSFRECSKLLEYCAIRFHYAVRTLLVRHGPMLPQCQIPIKRLADCAINIYVMCAVLSRASRSYCIGLRNADDDMAIAETITRDKHKEVKLTLEDLIAGEFYSTDHLHQKIAKKCLFNKHYHVEHPLKDNF